MFSKGHRADIGQARFFQTKVAGGATVCDLLLGQPDLLDAGLEVPFQGDRIGTAADETQILLLVMPPLAEMVLGWCGGK